MKTTKKTTKKVIVPGFEKIKVDNCTSQTEKVYRFPLEVKDKWQEWADMEIPTRKELGIEDWQKGFDEWTVCGYESASSDMRLANRITLVLTLVNVAILISLVIY